MVICFRSSTVAEERSPRCAQCALLIMTHVILGYLADVLETNGANAWVKCRVGFRNTQACTAHTQPSVRGTVYLLPFTI